MNSHSDESPDESKNQVRQDARREAQSRTSADSAGTNFATSGDSGRCDITMSPEIRTEVLRALVVEHFENSVRHKEPALTTHRAQTLLQFQFQSGCPLHENTQVTDNAVSACKPEERFGTICFNFKFSDRC